jgi:hypothetical protein
MFMRAVDNATTIPASRRFNKAEIADAFEVTLPTVDAWVRKGCPILQRGGRGISWELDVFAVYAWRHGITEGDEPAIDPEAMAPKDRLLHYEGNIKKRIDEIQDGEVVPSDEAREAMATLLKQTMLTLDTLTEVAERQASLSPEQSGVIEEIIDKERRALHANLVKSAPAAGT